MNEDEDHLTVCCDAPPLNHIPPSYGVCSVCEKESLVLSPELMRDYRNKVERENGMSEKNWLEINIL